MSSNSFENKIRDKFAGARMDPSPKVWEGIASKLNIADEDQKTLVFIPFYRRKENLRWAGLAAGVAAFATLWLGIVQWQPKVSGDDPHLHLQAQGIEEDLSPQESEATLPAKATEEVSVFSPPSEQDKPSGSSGLASKTGNPEKFNASYDKGFPVLAVHEVLSPTVLSSTKVGGKASIRERVTHLPSLTTASSPLGPVALPAVRVPDRLPVYGNGFAFNPQKTKAKPQLSWGLTAMASLQMQPLSGTYLAQGVNDNLQGIEAVATNLQFPRAFSAVRARLEYQLSKKWSLESGLGFSASHQNPRWLPEKAAEVELLSPNQFTGGLPFTNQDLAAVQSGAGNEVTYSSLDVPLLLNYYLGLNKGRSALMFSAGFWYQHNFGTQPQRLVETVYYTSNAPASTRFLDLNESSLNLGDLFYWVSRVHYHLKLNPQVAMHIGPNLSYGLSPAFRLDGRNSSRPVNLGLEFGIKFFPKS